MYDFYVEYRINFGVIQREIFEGFDTEDDVVKHIRTIHPGANWIMVFNDSKTLNNDYVKAIDFG